MKTFASIALMAAAVAAKNLGCYSSLDLGESANQSTNVYNSYGSCRSVCSVSAHKYTALSGDKCTCVDNLPPASALVGDDQCTEPCPGFSGDICGGAEGSAWTVLDTEPVEHYSSNPSVMPGITITTKHSGTAPTAAANITVTHASPSTTASTSSTDLSTSIPTAAAVSGSVYLGGLAVAAGLGAVVNIF